MIANPNRTQLNDLPETDGFTQNDLRLIRAMCRTANPWFPERPIFPAWENVYETAGRLLAD